MDAGDGFELARPRRRRFSDRPQVVVLAQQRPPALPGVQLRRGRARHVQRSHAARGDAASDHRGHPDRRVRDRLPSRVHLHPRRIPRRLRRSCATRSKQARAAGYIGKNLRQRLRSGIHDPPRRRRVHLRRRDRTAELARRQARRTAPQAAVSRPSKASTVTDRRQQRRDARLLAVHFAQRRGVVCEGRPGAVARLQGRFDLGPREEARQLRSSAGHDAAPADRRLRRRSARRPHVPRRAAGRRLVGLSVRRTPRPELRLRHDRESPLEMLVRGRVWQ